MIRGGIARERADDWKCPSCKRWFDGEEDTGVSGSCVDCEEAEEREYAEFEREQEQRARYEEVEE
jgi:hypothetical protein